MADGAGARRHRRHSLCAPDAPGAVAAPRVSVAPLRRGPDRRRPGGAGRTIPLVGFVVGNALLAVYDESVYQHGYAFGLALGLSGAGAAGVIAVASIAYVVGTIGGGSLSDVVGRRPVLVVAALGSATALVGFVHSSAQTVGYWAGLFGLLLGASVATRSAAWADAFAGPRLGRDVGIVAAGYPVGAAAVTYGGAAWLEAGGGFATLYAVAATAAVLWALLGAALAGRAAGAGTAARRSATPRHNAATLQRAH